MATRRYVAKELQLDPNSNGTGPVLTAAQLAAMLAAGAPQAANLIYAGPSSGGSTAPTFRSLVANDLPTVPITKGGTGATTAEGARTALGIDTLLSGKQDSDPLLSAIAALTTAANQLVYTTGADAVALTALTSFARGLLDDADAATARGTLGLGTGSTPHFLSLRLGNAVQGTLSFDVGGFELATDTEGPGFTFRGGGIPLLRIGQGVGEFRLNVFGASFFEGDLVPETSAGAPAHDIGRAVNGRWSTLYARDLDATGDLLLGGGLTAGNQVLYDESHALYGYTRLQAGGASTPPLTLWNDGLPCINFDGYVAGTDPLEYGTTVDGPTNNGSSGYFVSAMLPVLLNGSVYYLPCYSLNEA